MWLEIIADAYFEGCAFLKAFYFHIFACLGNFLLEDDGAVQQVADLEAGTEVAVEAVAGIEVQRMDSHLVDVAQL